MEQRALFAVILSILVLFLWQAYVVKGRRSQPVVPQAPAGEKITSPQAAPLPLREPAQETRIAPPERKPETFIEEEITVNTPLYLARFSTAGGRLKSMRLKAFRESVSPNSPLVDLVMSGNPQDLPLGVFFRNSSDVLSPHGFYASDKKDLTLKEQETGTLTLVHRSREGIRVTKTLTFHGDTYAVGLTVTIENQAPSPLQGRMSLIWVGEVTDQRRGAEYAGPVALIGGTLDKYTGKDGAAQEMTGDVRWAGFEDKYFIAAIIPRDGTQGVRLDSTAITLLNPLVVVPPKGVLTAHYELYLGPKDLGRLKTLDADLDRSIDYGFFQIIAKPLVLVLKALYSFSGNYGLAIIFLTVGVRVIFFPLNQMSYKSMKEMQKLQPILADLRERYKDDKERLNRETLELYKQHKVNPLGGCLPILIQIPVFIALYQALAKSIELRHAPFVLWIRDLSSPESLASACLFPSFCLPLRLLPFLMGVSTFLQQKMTPTTGDPQQAKMMLWFMPIMLTVIFWGLPSGLVLYWTVNNVLGIAQQFYINKKR